MNIQKQEKTRFESEEYEDGPPPGFQCIINPQAVKAEASDEDEKDDDGPPPGFDSTAAKPSPSSDTAGSSKEDDIDDDENEGPPPGWELSTLPNALAQPTTKTTDIETESNEELDEGPPPGWEKVLPRRMPPPPTPPLQSSSSVSSSLDIGSKPEKVSSNDAELPPSESQCNSTPNNSSPATPPPVQQPSLLSSELPNDTTGYKVNNKRVRIKRQIFGDHPALNPLPSAPPPAQSSSEKAQLVCGICRKLCLYPRGAKWVQCPGCQEVNFVLEVHEVRHVKCRRCAVLLMYPHVAPAVQCTSCLFVTEIGNL